MRVTDEYRGVVVVLELDWPAGRRQFRVTLDGQVHAVTGRSVCEVLEGVYAWLDELGSVNAHWPAPLGRQAGRVR